MHGISDFIAAETDGKNYKSYKYCFEDVQMRRLVYDDKHVVRIKRKGETDKSLTRPKSVKKLADNIQKSPPLFRYFLDGSRRTYKVDDIAYGKKLYPIIAGQIGVAVCERPDTQTFKPHNIKMPLVMVIPEKANARTSLLKEHMFYVNLLQKLNAQNTLQKQHIQFSKILSYPSSTPKDRGSYEDRGISRIQSEMMSLEQQVVLELVQTKRLNSGTFLIKDGSLEYMRTGDARNFSSIKSNYDCVVGVSKAFNPEALSEGIKNISRIIADLNIYERSPAYMYQTERIEDVRFAVWYLRIRDKKYTDSPFDGVLKIEKILVWDKQEREGLDSDEIDLISANIINERNPVSYGKDQRWAKHLYPVYLTENYIKSKYMSDARFINLF